MFAQKPTLKQSFMRRLGSIEVEPYRLGIVMQGEHQFGRFLLPGLHPPLNPWNERLTGFFNIKQRAATAAGKMASRDGYAVTATVSVQYTFDPSRADSRHQGEMISIVLSRHPDTELRKKMTQAVLYELRNQIQRYMGAELLSGEICRPLEQAIHRHLLRALTGLGIFLEGTGSVYVEPLEPSPELTREIQRQRMAQLMETYPQTGQQVLWLETISRQSGVIYHAENPILGQAITTETAVPEPLTVNSANNGDVRRYANAHPYMPKAC